jgi:hypothetical protein
MSLNINFDHNWSCCHRTISDNDNIGTLVVTNAADNSDWFSMELPHIAAVDEYDTIHNNLEKWWYRKQFQLILSNQQLKSSVLLTFKSPDNDTKDIGDSITSSISTVVWLDTEKIFSGSIKVPQISMELPQILLNSDQVKKYNHKHTLTVCCMNRCLSFNAFLTVPYNAIYNDIDSVNNISEYVNDVSNTVTDTMLEKVINEEKIQATNQLDGLNYSLVPLLTIVILIVGTRGDVQPSIA